MSFFLSIVNTTSEKQPQLLHTHVSPCWLTHFLYHISKLRPQNKWKQIAFCEKKKTNYSDCTIITSKLSFITNELAEINIWLWQKCISIDRYVLLNMKNRSIKSLTEKYQTIPFLFHSCNFLPLPITNTNAGTLYHQAPVPYPYSLHNTATCAHPPLKPALSLYCELVWWLAVFKNQYNWRWPWDSSAIWLTKKVRTSSVVWEHEEQKKYTGFSLTL